MTSRNEPLESERPRTSFVAFAGTACIAAGALSETAVAARRAQDEDPSAAILVFNRDTAEVVDLDLRGSEQDVAARYTPPTPSPARRGRPKLGVVAREVTLLPRHWEWLARQPGGASVTLRKLIEAARKDDAHTARARTDTAYRFMSAMAGNLPGFEEAARALFAGDRGRLTALMAAWPPDIGREISRFLDGPAVAGKTS
ncbi:MAG: DUF2239 family protein [Bauldia sp.]|nr:DUF2239 family protein [Bauldia sp.]